MKSRRRLSTIRLMPMATDAATDNAPRDSRSSALRAATARRFARADTWAEEASAASLRATPATQGTTWVICTRQAANRAAKTASRAPSITPSTAINRPPADPTP